MPSSGSITRKLRLMDLPVYAKSVPESVMYIGISDFINALAEFMSYYVRGATNGRQGSLRF